MTKLPIPALFLCLLLGTAALVMLPLSLNNHLGLVCFGLLCVVVPAHYCHVAVGYLLPIFEIRFGGRYLLPARGWFLRNFPMFDIGFVGKAYTFKPSDESQARIRILFIAAHISSLISVVVLLVLANVFGG